MSAEMVHLVENLVLASGMVAVTVLVHFWGFILLTNLMQRSGKRLRPHEHRVGQAALILLVDMAIRLGLSDPGRSALA